MVTPGRAPWCWPGGFLKSSPAPKPFALCGEVQGVQGQGGSRPPDQLSDNGAGQQKGAQGLPEGEPRELGVSPLMGLGNQLGGGTWPCSYPVSTYSTLPPMPKPQGVRGLCRPVLAPVASLTDVTGLGAMLWPCLSFRLRLSPADRGRPALQQRDPREEPSPGTSRTSAAPSGLGTAAAHTGAREPCHHVLALPPVSCVILVSNLPSLCRFPICDIGVPMTSPR